MRPTLADSQDPRSIIYIAKADKASVLTENGPHGRNQTLEIFLSDNSHVAHLPAKAMEKNNPGLVSVQTLTGSDENRAFMEQSVIQINGHRTASKLRFREYLSDSAGHSVRWSSGRALPIVGNDKEAYAVLNIRAKVAPTDPGQPGDIGGYSKSKDDLFDPLSHALREVSEKLGLIDQSGAFVIPKSPMARSTTFYQMAKHQAILTGLTTEDDFFVHGSDFTIRDDLYQNREIKVFYNNREETVGTMHMGFNLDPEANAGIDAQTLVEYHHEDPLSLQVAFMHGFHAGENFVNLSPDNYMLLVPVNQLIEEAPKGDDGSLCDVFVRNAYKDESYHMKANLGNVTMSVMNQLEHLAAQNYKFGQ